jgi:hypothetical protein
MRNTRRNYACTSQQELNDALDCKLTVQTVAGRTKSEMPISRASRLFEQEKEQLAKAIRDSNLMRKKERNAQNV